MSKKLYKVHDAFVKNLLRYKESASEFIKNALPPDVCLHFDLDKITYLPDTYVTKGLNEYISDIVLKIPVLGSKVDVNVSILVEHKSSIDHFTCVQLHNYISNGYLIQLKQKEQLSIIIPVIYYHGKGKWKYRPLHELFEYIPAGFERYIPFFSTELFQVQHLTINQIHGIAEAKLRAAFMVQKSLHDRMVATKDFVNVINALEPTDEGNFLHSFFVYISNVTNFNQNSIINITNQLTTDMKSKSMTFIEQFRAEGRKEESLRSRYEFARKLLFRNTPLEEICELTDLTTEQVLMVKKQIGEGND